MYRTMLGALAPITLALSLAGCGGETAEPVDAANPDAPAGISPGPRIVTGKLTLSPPTKVKVASVSPPISNEPSISIAIT